MSVLEKVLNLLLFPFKLIFILIVKFYKKVISPLIPASCKYYPSCSSYMLEAVKKYGFVRGFFIGFKRILRCNPKAKGGLDPVPDNVKGDLRWII